MAAQFSYENLMSGGLYGDRKPVKDTSLESFKEFGVASIINDGSTSHEFFGQEAYVALNEGNQVMQFVDASYESLAVNVALVKALKEKGGRSLEGVDPLSFTLEGVGTDFKAFAKKIWEAIKLALQKFATAVVNFVKQIMNWFKSLAIGAQDALYNQVKDKLDGLLASYGKVAKVKAAKVIIDRNAGYPGLVGALIEAAVDLDKTNSVFAATAIDGFDKAKVDEVKAHFSGLVSKLVTKTAITKKDGVTSPAKLISTAVYGPGDKVTATEMTVSEFVKGAADFATLTKAHGTKMKALVDLAKNISSNVSKAYASAGRKAAESDRIATSVAGAENKFGNASAKADDPKAKATKAGPASAVFVKNAQEACRYNTRMHGYMVGCLIATFSYYMRDRGSLAAAIRALKSAEAKATGAAKKAEKTAKK